MQTLVAVLIVFAVGFAGGFKLEHMRFIAYVNDIKIAQNEVDRLQSKNHDVDLQRVINAQSNSAKRLVAQQVVIAGANTELERLRGVITGTVPSAGICTDAGNTRTVAAGPILSECAGKYAEMARIADAHAEYIKLILEVRK